MKSPKPALYRDYMIFETPVCAREYRYEFIHKNYDGPEDRRIGIAETLEDAKSQIDETFDLS